MSIFDTFDVVGDAIGDTLSDLGDIALDIAEGLVETVEDVGDWAGEAAEDAADWAGEAVVDAAEWTGEALVDAGDGFLTACEESGFFDAVDAFSVGLVDLEYEDDGFSMNIGVKGVVGYGMDISEDGVGFRADAILASTEVSVGADGFGIAGSVGLDFGPFPYAEAHASVDPDGNFGIGGEVHLYIPTPVGMVGAEVGADYQQTNDGYRISGSVTGGYYAPTGTYAKAGVHASYEEDADGYHTNVGVHAELGQVGVGSVRVSADYNEGRDGDVRYSGVSASAEGETLGVSAGVEASYQHIETPDGEYDVVSGSAYGEVDGERIAVGATYADGPDGASLEANVRVSGENLNSLERSAESVSTSAESLMSDPVDVANASAEALPDTAAVPSEIGAVQQHLGDALDVLGSVPSGDAIRQVIASAPERVGPVPVDSGPADSGPADSGAADSGPADSGPADSGPADSGPVSDAVEQAPLTAEVATDDLSASFGSVIDDAIDDPQL